MGDSFLRLRAAETYGKDQLLAMVVVERGTREEGPSEFMALSYLQRPFLGPSAPFCFFPGKECEMSSRQ